ncbi:MAG: metallophosphoesterase family protein [Dissulfuribacterales bacterium]
MAHRHFYKSPKRMGLVADSHGNLEAMLGCIKRLNNLPVDSLVHLGDVFDSLHTDNLIRTVEAIQQNGIYPVKGNNDYQIEKMLSNGCLLDLPAGTKKKVLSFLEEMPMNRVENDICFTHSFPFDSVRSFYEPVDTGFTDRAEQIFNQTQYQTIFCGHSHSPILFRWRSGRVTRENINVEEKVFLNPSERYIIIVGSADSGECGFFDSEQKVYERICISCDEDEELCMK